MSVNKTLYANFTLCKFMQISVVYSDSALTLMVIPKDEDVLQMVRDLDSSFLDAVFDAAVLPEKNKTSADSVHGIAFLVKTCLGVSPISIIRFLHAPCGHCYQCLLLMAFPAPVNKVVSLTSLL